MGVAHFSWWLVPATFSFVMFQMTLKTIRSIIWPALSAAPQSHIKRRV